MIREMLMLQREREIGGGGGESGWSIYNSLEKEEGFNFNRQGMEAIPLVSAKLSEDNWR